MIIECLYAYLLDLICASTATLYSCFFLFSCYFISASCTAVWVPQRVCVYEWIIIYISGIVIAVCGPVNGYNYRGNFRSN